MEDLILAFVTFVASMFILSHLAGAGMDAFTIVMFVASIPLVGYLAYERGRSHRRWRMLRRSSGHLPFQCSTALPRFPLSGK
jgi:hypothetical protein